MFRIERAVCWRGMQSASDVRSKFIKYVQEVQPQVLEDFVEKAPSEVYRSSLSDLRTQIKE